MAHHVCLMSQSQSQSRLGAANTRLTKAAFAREKVRVLPVTHALPGFSVK